jgi:aquaporin Z
MKCAAELFGTFVLVMGGVGAAVLGGSQIGNLGVALAFGLSLLAMVYTIGPISGCHVNPAVTFGALLSGRISLKQAVGYMLAQIMGAIVAAAIVLFIASGGPNGYNVAAGGLAANGYGITFAWPLQSACCFRG